MILLRAVVLTCFAMLVGCGPIIIAYPPPTMLPGTLDAPGPGEVDIAAGASAFVAEGVAGNFYGGTALGAVDVGLGKGFDLSVTASQHLQGPTAGVTVARTFIDQPHFELAATAGLAGSSVDEDTTVQEDVLDENGDPVLDEYGEPVTEERTVEYAYLTVAPSLGARVVLRASEQVAFPIALRASHSWVVATKGLSGDMPRLLWTELMAGVVWRPVRAFGVGLGAGWYGVGNEHGYTVWPLPIVNASVDVRFGGRRE